MPLQQRNQPRREPKSQEESRGPEDPGEGGPDGREHGENAEQARGEPASATAAHEASSDRATPSGRKSDRQTVGIIQTK